MLFTLSVVLQAQVQEIAGDRIRAHVKFLASDLLEGRGVGQRGGDLATEYIATQLALIGVQTAGENGTYFQRVPLVSVRSKQSTLHAGDTQFAWQQDFIGVTRQQKEDVRFEADAIFVGHGIAAPEFQWDDYKGVDVRGKVLVLFTNEPPSEDPKFFDGRALTYYGRWTYKYEEALRRGAVAAILIHTSPTAGYGWDVVRGSFDHESEVELPPGEAGLALSGWVTKEAGEKLVAASGKTVDQLLEMANQRDFKPISLGVKIGGQILSSVRKIESRNVVGIVPGSDQKQKSEAVLFSAHWDHLGIGTPVDGDAIYNGAVDNATGCAMVLEMARAWATLPRKPRRSAVFLWVTAEEDGLKGSEYYGLHPAIAADETALNLNFDAFYPFGRTKDISVSGAEKTAVWPTVREVAKRFQFEIKPDPRPEQGHYFRSDHFSLARVGVPAFSIDGGNDFYGKPAGYGDKVFEEYNDRHYHRPSDEYRDDWDFAGMVEIARFGFTLGYTVANQTAMPARMKP